jgi:hypothetical protein
MGMEIPTTENQKIATPENTESVGNVSEIQGIQNRIFNILDNPGSDDQPIENIEIPKSWKIEGAPISEHDKFLALLQPRMKGKKILDIFCGDNAPKKFLQIESKDTEVTGIDLAHEEADIKGNVEEIDKLIKPEKQFDYLLSFGGISEHSNYEVLRNYIKDNGFFITNCSGYIYRNAFAPVFANPELARKEIPDSGEVRKMSYFRPLAVIAIPPDEEKAKEPRKEEYNQHLVYIIWKKRNSPILPAQEDIARAARIKETIAKKRNEIDQFADAEGKGIDEEIKEAVVALNLLGFDTTQSCQGHYGEEEGGFGAPWVQIEQPNQPEERFQNQNEIFKRVAEKYNLTLKQLKHEDNADAWGEALREASQQGETPEFQEWNKKNQELLQRVKELLDEFYKNREGHYNEDMKLEIEEFADMFRIHNGGEDYKMVDENISENEKIAHAHRLFEYQREMRNFAYFLLDKFHANFK